MNIESTNANRKISATKQEGNSLTSAAKPVMTMSNYQIGAGTVSNFNSPHVSQANSGQPGSINVSGRRLKQQNCSHNNFGSLMTSPGKFNNQ